MFFGCAVGVLLSGSGPNGAGLGSLVAADADSAEWIWTVRGKQRWSHVRAHLTDPACCQEKEQASQEGSKFGFRRVAAAVQINSLYQAEKRVQAAGPGRPSPGPNAGQDYRIWDPGKRYLKNFFFTHLYTPSVQFYNAILQISLRVYEKMLPF